MKTVIVKIITNWKENMNIYLKMNEFIFWAYRDIIHVYFIREQNYNKAH